MADLRIVDAPVLLQESITDDVKMPTGGLGNYAIRLGDLAWYVVAKENLASKSYVDTSSKGVQDNLDIHVDDNNNPHQVTKEQVGLGNVDNTADVDKPVSNATKSYIDKQDALKADKNATYTKIEVDSKVNAVSGGYIGAFATLAELNAKTGMTTGQVAKVMNDTTAINNGDYRYTGSAWVKGYDPLADAKTYTDSSLKPYVKTYNTLAELNAVTGMTAGQVAKVSNDTTATNIGDYRYSGTAWVKFSDSAILADAKTYTDAQINNSTEVLSNSFVQGGDALGLPVVTDTVYSSGVFDYVPNSNIVITKPSTTTTYQYGYSFSDDKTRFNAPTYSTASSLTISNPNAKYVKFYVSKISSQPNKSITTDELATTNISYRFINYNLNNNRLVLSRTVRVFDNIKITANDFELGDDATTGAMASTNTAKTKPYYLKNGGTIIFNGSLPGFNYRIAVSDNPNTGFGTKQSFTSGSFTVTADKPYFKLYATAGTFNYDNFKALSTFYFTTSLDLSRYSFDLVDKIGREDFYNLNEFKKLKVTEADFAQGLVSLGAGTGMVKSDAYLQTKAFKVKAGDTITVSCPATTPKFLWNYGTGVTRVTTASARNDGYTETSFTFTVPTNMNYIVFGARKQDGTVITADELALFKFTAILNKTVADEKVDSNTLTAAVPKKYVELTQNDFLFGEEDNIAYMTSRNLRSKLSYKMPIGGIAKLNITVTATHTPLIFGALQGDSYYAVARSPNTVTEMTQLPNRTVTSSAGKEYFKIYVATKDTSLMTVEQFKALQFTVKVEMLDDVAYQSDLSQLAYNQNKTRRNVSRFLESSASSYRTPSLAQGGVISFIDDDYRIQTYTELYPVIKANNIPYGVAVIPNFVGRTVTATDTYGTEEQLWEMSGNYNVEIMSHTWAHTGMSASTYEQQHEALRRAKEWFISQGIYVKGFVYPFGQDSSITYPIVNQYYESAYDFGANVIENFDTIRNYTIQRYTFNYQSDMAVLKAAIDQAHATNGWIVFTTHAGLANYWYDGATNEASPMPSMLVELANYAKSVGCKLLKPSDAFQIYGNIVESDSGFKITAQGKIVGATIA